MLDRRVAGILSFAFIVASGIHFGVFEQPLLPTRASSEVAAYLTTSPLHARAGALLDLVVFATGIAMSVALYRLVQTASPHRAQLILVGMLVAFTVAVTIELSTFAALSLATNSELGALAAVLRARSEGYGMVTFFFALALGAWSLLAAHARVLPRFLAVPGASACGLMFVATGAKVLWPTSVETFVLVTSLAVMAFQVALAVSLLKQPT